MPKYHHHTSWIYRLGRWLFSLHTWIVFHTYLRVKVHFLSPLPKGSFLVCSNHQSHLDAIILGYLSKGNFDRVAFIAAKDYWYDHQWRYRFSNLFFNLIPISRNNSSGYTIKQTIASVNEFTGASDHAVIMLPEGTRSKDGHIKKFKPGIVTLARACHLPVVPVYIHHSRRFWPKGSFFIQPGQIDVSVGGAIFPDTLIHSDILRDEIIAISKNYE